jgi:hypothetical protein
VISLLDKWGEYYHAVTVATIQSGVSKTDRQLVERLVDSVIIYHRDDRIHDMYDGLCLLSSTFFPGGSPTFAPEQLHPHFVDLLPDLKSWADSISERDVKNFWATRVGKTVSWGRLQKNSATRVGATLLLRDLEERRKLNEIFA